jgi:hypothetical protein
MIRVRSPREVPPLGDRRNAKICHLRRCAEGRLTYYLQWAPTSAEYLPEVWANYFREWVDAEAMFYSELIPTDPEIKLWLDDLFRRTLAHRYESTQGKQFESEVAQHIEFWAQALQETRFKEDSLKSHFESLLDQLETELLTAQKNLVGATLHGLETLDPRKTDKEILTAISRFFDSTAFPIILAFAGRPVRSKSTYQNLAMETERCFLTALKNSQSLRGTSSTLYPFLSKTDWLEKHRAQIREACRHRLFKWHASIFDPDGEPATSSAMDALDEGDETTCSTNAKARSSFVTPMLEKKGKQRLSASVTDYELANKIPGYLEAKAIGLAKLAEQTGTTERTLRKFRRSGKVRRDIYCQIKLVLNPRQE